MSASGQPPRRSPYHLARSTLGAAGLGATDLGPAGRAAHVSEAVNGGFVLIFNGSGRL
jgi:hypothetical protein